MQKFKVVLEITANTYDTVTNEDIHEAIELLTEDFDGGAIEIKEVTEQ